MSPKSVKLTLADVLRLPRSTGLSWLPLSVMLPSVPTSCHAVPLYHCTESDASRQLPSVQAALHCSTKVVDSFTLRFETSASAVVSTPSLYAGNCTHDALVFS